MLGRSTAAFIRQHPIVALLAAAAVQIAGFVVLLAAALTGSHGLRMGAFTIGVIGASVAAAVMIFLARTRSARSARSAVLGASLFVASAGFTAELCPLVRHAPLDWLADNRRCGAGCLSQSEPIGRARHVSPNGIRPSNPAPLVIAVKLMTPFGQFIIAVGTVALLASCGTPVTQDDLAKQPESHLFYPGSHVLETRGQSEQLSEGGNRVAEVITDLSVSAGIEFVVFEQTHRERLDIAQK